MADEAVGAASLDCKKQNLSNIKSSWMKIGKNVVKKETQELVYLEFGTITVFQQRHTK